MVLDGPGAPWVSRIMRGVLCRRCVPCFRVWKGVSLPVLFLFLFARAVLLERSVITHVCAFPFGSWDLGGGGLGMSMTHGYFESR